MVFLLLLITAVEQPASLAQPPRLLNPTALFQLDDYPTKAVQNNESGIVSTLLSVDDHGRVTNCAVTESSGSAALDTGTCTLLRRKARFKPATDAAGHPVNSTHREMAGWSIGPASISPIIQLMLTVPATPSPPPAPITARLDFDSQGRVTECRIVRSGGNAADETACKIAAAKLTIAPPHSRSADIVPVAVRDLIVTFRSASQAN
jgi:TonB family protein